MSMRVIPPLPITTARLTSTTVPEVAPAAYVAGATYSAGDQRSIAGAAGLISVYQSLQNANTGHAPAASPTWWQYIGDTYQSYAVGATYAIADRVIDPAAHRVYASLIAGNTGQALTDPTKWFDVGPTNAWQMFDTLRSSATVSPGPISVSITPNARVDAIALLGLAATQVTITQTVGGVPQYTTTENLNLRIVTDWYSYFFGEFTNKSSMIRFDLPPYAAGVITIAISNANGSVACGALVIGMSKTLGVTQRGAQSDALNFSTVDRSTAGVAVMTPQRNVPKTISNIVFDRQNIQLVRYVRELLNATPAVWAGIEDSDEDYFESLLILGFYRRYTINLKEANEASIDLELEEV